MGVGMEKLGLSNISDPESTTRQSTRTLVAYIMNDNKEHPFVRRGGAVMKWLISLQLRS